MTQEYTLRAMAKNYAGGHSWDHLDGEACAKAADEIKQLRAEIQLLRVDVKKWTDAYELTAAQVEQLQAKVDGTKAGRDFHIGTASELLALLADIIDAENDFRESMGVNWEGDPLSDAIEAARRFIKLETPALPSTDRKEGEA